MQQTNEFEPCINSSSIFPPVVRRESWVTLHRRRSQRLETLQNLLIEEKTPNSLKNPFSFIHVFTLLLCITKCMKCKLCSQLFLDVTMLSCGHGFCKSCLQSWLQTKEHCPICLKMEVLPVCNRCYHLDALVESFYNQLLEILDPTMLGGGGGNEFLVDGDQSQSQKLKTRLENIRKMHKVRTDRRQSTTGSICIIKQSPNRSMLQGVIDLGFGLRNSIDGFILLVIGSFFLALSLCQFSELLETLELFTIRRLLYVALIIYLIYSQRTPFFHIADNATRLFFWEQIFRTTVTEVYDPLFRNEKERMILLIKKKEIDFGILERAVKQIIVREKLGVLCNLLQKEDNNNNNSGL